MKIRNFKLVSGGLSGAVIEYYMPKNVNSLTYKNKNVEEHNAPVPQVLKDRINDLKVYFLNLAGYWRNSYDEYIDYENLKVISQSASASEDYFEMRDVLSRTTLIGVKFDGVKFSMSGKIEIPLGEKEDGTLNIKTMAVNTVAVQASDEWESYQVVSLIVKECYLLASKYVKGDIVQDPKSFIKDHYTSKGKTLEDIKDIMADMKPEDYIAFMEEQLTLEGRTIFKDEDNDELMEGVVAEGEEEVEEELTSTVVDTKDVPKQMDLEDEINEVEATTEPNTVEAADESKSVLIG